MGYLRHPRTTAEKRSSLENAELIRPKRSGHNLPNAWDDIPHGRRGRSDRHKNHRRKR